MKFTASIQSDLTAKLLALPEAADFKVRTEALKAAAAPIRDELERNAPRRTGQLAMHIIVDPYTQGEIARGMDFTGGEAAVAVGPDRAHFYGYFSEYGTVHEPARPWFRPVFDTKARIAFGIVAGKLWESIRAAASTRTTGNVGSRNL